MLSINQLLQTLQNSPNLASKLSILYAYQSQKHATAMLLQILSNLSKNKSKFCTNNAKNLSKSSIKFHKNRGCKSCIRKGKISISICPRPTHFPSKKNSPWRGENKVKTCRNFLITWLQVEDKLQNTTCCQTKNTKTKKQQQLTSLITHKSASITQKQQPASQPCTCTTQSSSPNTSTTNLNLLFQYLHNHIPNRGRFTSWLWLHSHNCNQ